MKYKLLFQEENEAIRERYELAIERIGLMEQEISVKEPYTRYFHKIATFVLLIKNVVDLVEEDRISNLSLKELQSLNRALYEDITGDNYNTSYANPT